MRSCSAIAVRCSCMASQPHPQHCNIELYCGHVSWVNTDIHKPMVRHQHLLWKLSPADILGPPCLQDSTQLPQAGVYWQMLLICAKCGGMWQEHLSSPAKWKHTSSHESPVSLQHQQSLCKQHIAVANSLAEESKRRQQHIGKTRTLYKYRAVSCWTSFQQGNMQTTGNWPGWRWKDSPQG